MNLPVDPRQSLQALYQILSLLQPFLMAEGRGRERGGVLPREHLFVPPTQEVPFNHRVVQMLENSPDRQEAHEEGQRDLSSHPTLTKQLFTGQAQKTFLPPDLLEQVKQVLQKLSAVCISISPQLADQIRIILQNTHQRPLTQEREADAPTLEKSNQSSDSLRPLKLKPFSSPSGDKTASFKSLPLQLQELIHSMPEPLQQPKSATHDLSTSPVERRPPMPPSPSASFPLPFTASLISSSRLKRKKMSREELEKEEGEEERREIDRE